MNQTLYDKIETCVVVTVIAMLIWLWAEGENVTTDQWGVTVRFEAADLHIESPETLYVQVRFNCATSQTAQVKNLGTITIPVSTDMNGTMVLTDQLAAKFAAAGASIIDTDPATYELKVEPMDSLMLQVQIEPGALMLKEERNTQPNEVQVSGPASEIQQLENLILQAPLVIDDPAALADGRAKTRSVRVRLPDGYDAANLTFDPPTVDVTFTIDTMEVKTQLDNVPIHFEFTPGGFFNDYIIEVADEKTRLAEPVEVSGPRDIISELTSQDVTAILVLTNEELEKGSGSKQLIFRITQPGVVVTSLHLLGYTATPRPAEPPQ